MSGGLKIKANDMESGNVTAEDQQKINKFARLHLRFEEFKNEIKRKTNEMQNVSEAADEILLLDDEDAAAIPLKVGDTFVKYNSDILGEKLEKMKTQFEEEISEIQNKQTEIQAEMAKLKVDLYGKFGNSINLESEDE